MLGLLVASLAAAPILQDSVRVSVTLSPDRIVAGESAVLEVRVETRGESPRAINLGPLPAGFDLVGTQDFSQTQLGFGGARTQLTGRSWVLVGRVPGTFRLPSPSVTVGTDVRRTDSLTIVVLPAPAGPVPQGAAERVRLSARVEPERVYVGQQVTFVAEAVFPRELRQRQTRPATYQAPNPSGFWAQDLPDPLVVGVRAVGPRIYDTQTFRRAYFPLLSGRQVFPPAILAFEYRPSLGSPPVARELASDSLILTVMPLPDADRPESFTGAVGRYSIRARLEPALVRTGEAATLRVTVAGTGNVKSLPAPRLAPVPGLEVLSPSESADVDATLDPLGGTKSFEWVVVPRGEGRIALDPIEYGYFDPERARYDVARTDTVVLEVSGVTATTDPGIELRPLRARPSGDPLAWVRSPAFAAVQAIPLLVILAALWRAKRPPPAVAQRAEERRRKRFASLREEALAPDRGFWGRLAEAIRQGVADILDRPGLGTAPVEAVRQGLREAGVPGPTCSALADLLDSLDRIRFAADAVAPADAPALVERAERLLSALGSTVSRRPGKASRRMALMALALPLSPTVSQDSTFDRALDAYRGARYAESAAAFADYLESHPRDADAWYDAGNAYYLSGQGPRAVRAWMRALRLRPRQHDARRNLAATARPALAHVPPPYALSAEEGAIGLALVWWVAALLVTARLRRRRPLAAPLAVTGAVAVLIGALSLTGLTFDRTAVTLAPETVVRADPAFRADEIERVAGGLPVTIVEHRPGWSRVRTATGKEGWIESAELLEI